MAEHFTLEDVAKHTTRDDLWLIIHNKVYNVSKYLEDHPGGADILIELAGTDATNAFEDVGHSDEAREAMEPFLVGELHEEHKLETVEIYRPKFEAVEAKQVLKRRRRSPLKTAAAVGALGGLAAYFRRSHLHLLVGGHIVGRGGVLERLPKLVPQAKGGFWYGFLTAAAISTTAMAIGAQFINHALDVHKDFQGFPPRIKPTTVRIYRKSAPPAPVILPPCLDPKEYRKFPLVEKTKLSPNVYRFVFGLPTPTSILGLPIGQHIAIRATLDGKAVTRSYTPTSNDSDPGKLVLVVKVYPGGLITNYLAGLNIGDLVDIRGPKGAMKYHKDLAKNIGMIAGGTGITPMYQLIRAICEDPTDNTNVSLLYANQTEEDILLREELDNFAKKCPHKFNVHYVLDRPSNGWTGGRGYVSKELIAERIAAPAEDSKVMLCGPPGMINAMKNNLGQLGFTVPGAVAKATDQVFMF